MSGRIFAPLRVVLALAAVVSIAGFRSTPPKVADVDWRYYGQSTDETHYSPLAQITPDNIGRLKLWAVANVPASSGASMPLAVDGVVYVALGLSHVYAVEAATGKTLWTYDPEVGRVAGMKLRYAWGIRGLAYADGKVIVGAQDGRLIALDAKSGALAWSVDTTAGQPDLYITGAPRVMGDKVIIGNGGADTGLVRGYVSAYEVATGKPAWRFYTVPGDPAKPPENRAMQIAAPTWSSESFRYGGGGTAWNAMTYDAELGRIYIGVGNGDPWNWKIRNPEGKDNLFVASIVALDARTGEYVWHYQVNPNDAWDYSAAMDMVLATVVIDGKPRKVLMQAPKNGFFYVLDRETGRPISAEKFVKVTWARSIDMKTGRPVEEPDIRYQKGTSTLWPSFYGGHNWQPMAFSPKTGLVYLTTLNLGASWSDAGIVASSWKPTPGLFTAALVPNNALPGDTPSGDLLAWDPVKQKAVWKTPVAATWGPGPMATASGLVFSGDPTGHLMAYAAQTGKQLWSISTGVAVTSPPITFSKGGRQYVAVLTGPPTSVEANVAKRAGVIWDYRKHPRRLLIYALDGAASLPPAPPPGEAKPYPSSSPADPKLAALGKPIFMAHCMNCHGREVISGGGAPDLRASVIPTSAEAFHQVVLGGALQPAGMPRFQEFTTADAEAVRAYIRSRAEQDLSGGRPRSAQPVLNDRPG